MRRERKTGKRLIKHLAIILLVCVLIFTPIMIVPAAVGSDDSDQSDSIISLLEQLAGNASLLTYEDFEHKIEESAEGRKGALLNKIGAVINKIEAGAYKGAVDKLKNDIKKKILEWIDDESEMKNILIDLVDKIISIIEGVPPVDSEPPEIHEVWRDPEKPEYEYNETVTVKALVTDEDTGVEHVILYYWNGSALENVTMVGEEPLYTGTIRPLPYGTMVEYWVNASDYAENWAVSDEYFYTVTDKYLPTARIDYPNEGSYLAGQVSIVVYAYDDNFVSANLTIDGEPVSSWTSVGTHTYNWDTTTPDYPDGIYTVKLTAYDVAGNNRSEKITVTVDNTPPLVIINAPAEGSYLKGTVLVDVAGTDANFDKMELYIDDTLVETWTKSGSHVHGWNTTAYPDESCMITLTVYDKAANRNETAVTVTVDNTPPTASITAPADESLLKDTVLVSVTGNDDNFKNIELYIGDNLVVTFDESGANNYKWDTSAYTDDVYKIALKVYDKADNLATDEITVTTDNTLPFAEIRKPTKDAFLRGSSDIIVYGYDTHLEQIELYIDGDPVETWNVSGVQTRTWDTTTLVDGSHTIKLTVSDKAGNVGEETITVTADNTLPSATINAPAEGSYVKGTTTVSVTGNDANFDKMELYVDDDLKQTWTTPESHSYSWDTTDHPDGSHTIAMKVYDKAENTVEKTVAVNVDNTPPSIGTPSWEPEEPYADKQVNVTALVSDPAPGSGLKSVTLWYKNKTDGEWQSIEMAETTLGNWTATIPGQSTGENVTFYIESLDNVENSAETQTYSYIVRAPPVPWALFAAVGLGIAALVATAIYLWYRRRKKKSSASTAASPSKSQTKPVVTLYIPANILAGYEEDR